MPIDLLNDFATELESRINSCSHHPAQFELAQSLDEVREQWAQIQKCRPEARTRHLRWFAKNDLFFLGRYILGWFFVDHPWQFERAREIQTDPDGVLDLWSRGHCKTTWKTYTRTIFDILNNPNIAICIFSHTRPVAKAFLRVIKQIFETNTLLRSLFPEIIWDKPNGGDAKWALASDTPVLTTDGWKLHGDLKTGDKVYGVNGRVITVTGNSGPLNADCYRVRFDDCELIASGDHLWAFEEKLKQKSPWLAVVKPTTELKAKSKRQRLPATPIIEIPSRDLPLDPYILGLWLGDGTAGTNIISMHRDDEPEILEQFQEAGFDAYIHRRKPEDNFSMYGLRGLKEKIAALGCLKDKHIPTDYLLADTTSRLALLQGLMDSDGTCKKNNGKAHHSGGMCTFSNTNEKLADGVHFLACSLGFRPSRCSFMPKERGRKRANHIYFVGLESMPPFRLKRKAARCLSERTKAYRYIREIEKIEQVPINCIKVDAVDGLYLAGRNLVPTHNSEDDGICVKRPSVRLEQTVEAFGLVDGQPTSRHYDILLYDDVVTLESVTSSEMIEKTTNAWEISLNLALPDTKTRYNGTFYHENDTYHTIIDRGIRVRRYPIFMLDSEGKPLEDHPVFFSPEQVEEKRKQGKRNFALQCLLDPALDTTKLRWKVEWLGRYSHRINAGVNVYILVDPANEQRKHSDYTTMAVIGLGADQNYYLLDLIRDRLNLKQRTEKLFALHQKYMRKGGGMKPQDVGYEMYGKDSDIQHIQEKMDTLNYHFNITPLAGRLSKRDRINKLQPSFEEHRWWLPQQIFQVDYQGQTVELVSTFIQDEFIHWPDPKHDDMLDCLSRILDPKFYTSFPMGEFVGNLPDYPEPLDRPVTWQSA